MGWPVAASQSRAERVLAPCEDRLAVGTERHRSHSVLMHEGLTDGTMGGGVPESRRLVSAPGENGPAVGTVRHGHDLAPMPEGRSDGLAGGGVPEPRRLVRAAGEDGLAVGAERHAHDHALVPQGLADGLAGGGVPEPRGTVVAPGEDGLAVGAEGGGIDGTFVGKDRLESGVMRPPRGQVGPRGVLPDRIAGCDRRPPALDHPEQARADLPFLEGRLAAVEVADRQQTIRCGQRCREASVFLAEVCIRRVISLLALACSVA